MNCTMGIQKQKLIHHSPLPCYTTMATVFSSCHEHNAHWKSPIHLQTWSPFQFLYYSVKVSIHFTHLVCHISTKHHTMTPFINYRIHKRQAPVPILSNSVHASPSHFLKINFNIIFPSTRRSSQWSPSLGFSHQNPV